MNIFSARRFSSLSPLVRLTGRVWMLVWMLGAGAAAVHGQGAAGGLRGSIQDADFFMPVPGVQIMLEGTSFTTQTDNEGRFFLNDLPAGQYAVLARKSGYISGRRAGIVVSGGSVREVSLDLTAEVVELDDFIVEAALEEELESPALTFGAPLQTMAQALRPELLKASGSGGNIGSAVSRMTSTAVVDSRYVVIRGLSDRYNVVVLNSARLPSSDPDKRAVNIDIFPTGLVETLVSSKTYVPWMPGETTGGYLNVVTKRLPKEPFLNFSISTAHNTNTTGRSDFLSYKGGGTGFLGTSRERAMPDGLNSLNLPFDASALTPNYTIPTVGSPTPENAEKQQHSANRLTAAQLLADRPMGVTTKTAPENFSFSLIGGTTIPDFLGADLGLVGGVTYAKRYTMEEGIRGRGEVGGGQISNFYLEDFARGQESLLAGGLLSAALDWGNDVVTLTWFANLAADDEAVFGLGENLNVAPATIGNGIPVREEFANGNATIFREALGYTERWLQTFQLTGEHELADYNDIKLSWQMAYSNSYQDQPDLRKSFVAFQPGIGYIAPGDPSPPEHERVWRRVDDSNYYIGLDLEVPFMDGKEGEDRVKFKFGGVMDRSSRRYVSENFEYIAGFTPTIAGLSGISPDDSQGLTFADQLGQADLIDVTTSASRRPPGTTFTDNLYLVRGRSTQPTERYTASQIITAAYAATIVNIGDDLEFTVGARLESTDMRFKVEGIDLLDPNQGAGAILRKNVITGEDLGVDEVANPSIVRTDLLPALSAKWALTDHVNLRSAISRTVARPTFKEIAPAFTRDPASGELFVGNVKLDMSSIINYDLRVEYDMGRGDMFAVNFFAKRITKPIEQINLDIYNSALNEERAIVYGLELELAKNLGFIPLLENVTFSTNYGYVFSRVDLTPQSEALRTAAGLSRERALQGQPEYTFNASLTYDNKDSGFSAGVLVNVTGNLLYAVGGQVGTRTTPDVFQRPYTSVDAYISKKVAPHWELQFRASNLLDATRRREYADGIPYSVTENGTTYSLGLAGKW
ncbi:MAG: TonB-dependent receptor [Verrucomicrobiaceae bacterium]|nr:TonB-dependent receptor [Verrucomicrobiaceae bacterium]